MTEKQTYERAARMYHTDGLAAIGMEISTTKIRAKCREFGIETPNERAARQQEEFKERR